MEEKLLTVETKPLTYLCKFDENGRRSETRLSVDYTDEQKADMLESGFVEITQEEWEYYVGNKGNGDNGTGYIRVTGKPVSAPAHIPITEEKLAVLDMQYEADKALLREYLTDALLVGDDDTIAELRQEMADIDAQYEAEREAVANG